jgi:Xaa-Pro aminopeptidase
VAKHFRAADTWGYASEAEVLTVEWGHGVGLVSIGSSFTSYNLPAINRQWSIDHPQILEPGMVIALEALEGEPGVGGARLENMVLVSKEGVTLLDSYPRDSYIEVR